MSSGVGRRYGSNPTLLWLWCRPGATALIQPLAWEPPFAADVALKKPKQKAKPKEKTSKVPPKATYGIFPGQGRAGVWMDLHTGKTKA